MGAFCDWFSDTPPDEISNLTGDSQVSANWGKCIGDGTTLYDFLLLGLATSIISILGVFGNALSALVLIRSQFRSSVNFLLLGLTFSDTIVILYTFATFALPAVFGYFNFARIYNYEFFPLISPYFFPIASIGKRKVKLSLLFLPFPLLAGNCIRLYPSLCIKLSMLQNFSKRIIRVLADKSKRLLERA